MRDNGNPFEHNVTSPKNTWCLKNATHNRLRCDQWETVKNALHFKNIEKTRNSCITRNLCERQTAAEWNEGKSAFTLTHICQWVLPLQRRNSPFSFFVFLVYFPFVVCFVFFTLKNADIRCRLVFFRHKHITSINLYARFYRSGVAVAVVYRFCVFILAMMQCDRSVCVFHFSGCDQFCGRIIFKPLNSVRRTS